MKIGGIQPFQILHRSFMVIQYHYLFGAQGHEDQCLTWIGEVHDIHHLIDNIRWGISVVSCNKANLVFCVPFFKGVVTSASGEETVQAVRMVNHCYVIHKKTPYS